MILAVLEGHVAAALQQIRNRRILRLQTKIGTRESDFQQPCTKRTLSSNECCSARRAALLSVIVGEERALLRDAVDVRRVIAHHAQVVGADVGVADIVTKDDENVGRFGAGCLRLRGRNAGRKKAPLPRALLTSLFEHLHLSSIPISL